MINYRRKKNLKCRNKKRSRWSKPDLSRKRLPGKRRKPKHWLKIHKVSLIELRIMVMLSKLRSCMLLSQSFWSVRSS